MNATARLHHVSVPMPPGGNARAREFYGSRLGLREKSVPDSLDANHIIWFDLGPDGDELHVFTEQGNGPSVGAHLCIQVEDVLAWRQTLADNGVDIEETERIVNRPRFFVRDPFGNRLEITQVLGDYTAPPVDSAAQ